MGQPTYFDDGTGIKIPRVDENGYIILSPTSTVNFSGSIDLSGASIDVDIPHYIEGTATTAADGIVALGRKASNTLATFALDENRNIKTVLVDATALSVSVTNQIDITAAALPLPAGAATSAKQDTTNSYLATLASAITSAKMQVDIISAPTLSVIGNFSAGTEYAENAAVATATGSVFFAKFASNTLTGLLVDSSKYLRVNVSDSTLPSGAATAANQSTIIGHVDGLEALLSTISSALNSAITGGAIGITAASLPLPSGAATAARQDTTNTYLATISANQITLIGHVDGVEGLLGTIASAINSAITGGAINTELPTAVALDDSITSSDAPYVGSMLYGYKTASGTWDRLRVAGDNADSLGTALTGHLQILSHQMGFNGTTWDRLRSDITNGLDVDVTRVSGQVEITAAALPLPTGAATAANQTTLIGHVDGIETFLGTLAAAVGGTQMRITATALPLPSGAATSANQSTMITSLATLAAAVAGNEFQVDVITLPTLTTLPIASNSAAGSAFTVSTAVVTLAAANTNRRCLLISNNAGGNLFIGETTSVASSGVNMGIIVPPFSVYSDSGFGVYTGIIYGIYSTAMTSHCVAVRDRS